MKKRIRKVYLEIKLRVMGALLPVEVVELVVLRGKI